MNGVAYCRKIRRQERTDRDSAPLKGDCNEQDRWRRRLDDEDLEGKDQARVTGKVLGGEIIRYGEGEPLEGDSHLIGERDSLERSRLLSLNRAPGTNGS